MMICYDVEFPEVPRSYAVQGAQLFLVPTALMTKLMTEITVVSRAVENNAFLAYANRVGPEHCKKLSRGTQLVSLADLSGFDLTTRVCRFGVLWK